jgi:hypothetical protein
MRAIRSVEIRKDFSPSTCIAVSRRRCRRSRCANVFTARAGLRPSSAASHASCTASSRSTPGHSRPETSAIHARRAVRSSPEATRLLMSSCISASGTVNQRLLRARGLSIYGETIREHARDGPPGARPRHRAGPLQETSTHATPCRKARTHAAKRERPGREARAFTLNRSARQFRARLLK